MTVIRALKAPDLLNFLTDDSKVETSSKTSVTLVEQLENPGWDNLPRSFYRKSVPSSVNPLQLVP